jgi:hypothetical protein
MGTAAVQGRTLARREFLRLTGRSAMGVMALTAGGEP